MTLDLNRWIQNTILALSACLVLLCPTFVDAAEGTAKLLRGERNFSVLINGYQRASPELQPWTTRADFLGGVAGAAATAKYDAAQSGKTHAFEWQVQNSGSDSRRGWATAAVLYPEPLRSVVVNDVRFSSADMKALLSELGRSARGDSFGGLREGGLLPNEYFLVLTQLLGRDGHGVVVDLATPWVVRDQPVAGYEFSYPTKTDDLGEDPLRPGVYRFQVRSRLYWGDENSLVSHVLAMELWLDGPVVFDRQGRVTRSGNLILRQTGQHFAGQDFEGGAWQVGTPRAIGMWVPYLLRTDSARESNPELNLDWVTEELLRTSAGNSSR